MLFMAARIIDITTYIPKRSDIFFFDNNIWMFLFCPIANYGQSQQRQYSAFLQKIKSAQASIFVTSGIRSELANTYLRLDFEELKREEGLSDLKFKKHYVGSDRYRETVEEIKINVNKILSFCEKSSDNFTAIEIENIFKHFSEIDFNDSYYIELAKLGKWKVVTDDSDF